MAASITVPNILNAGLLITDADLATYRQAILDLTAAIGASSGGAPVVTGATGPQAMDLSATTGAGQAIGWSILGFNSVDFFQGSTMTSGGNGITVSVSGRFVVSATIIWSTNGTGLRGIGFGSGGGSSPGNLQIVGPASATNITGCELSQEMSLTAGSTCALYGYQSSGAALSAGFRHMSLRQVA